MTKPDIIEIMARAIYHATPRNKPFELLGQHDRQYEKQARAALSALHEAGFIVVPTRPTPAMKKAGARVTGNYDIAHECFVQMIQAAQVPHD